MSFFFSNSFPQAQNPYSVAIIRSEFNETLTAKLLSYAEKGFKKCGIPEDLIEIFSVPGALEIPFATKKILDTGNFDGILALGIVIRGETYHFELVANESARGILELSMEGSIPIINGILTTENEVQITQRLEKGMEFAASLVKMMNLMTSLNEKI
ncbi:6,7-dimethyl-8-ribityllumazine synthase [Candidatus Peregrinibacteria bacterium]|nr:6,7-dimethyl-8-ribityllumazine synthase [Candidatus Peregrinibacteria bacterium]